MGAQKKAVRDRFRTAVFERARYKCEMCGFESSVEKCRDELDAHHITDRSMMPAGGYVKENGISVCKPCHEKAEEFHSTGKSHPGYDPTDLYKKIGSHYSIAFKASQKLERQLA
jgi:predicted restriction endonuclease